MAINLNVGILGHVDSGKTSLAKCLSEIASTAAFDKSPQSQERGITLDLGFSSFSIPIPEHLMYIVQADYMQFTLVDCPGHASLIKTIIGGAQIIDMMLLVIDITKGIQTQTAECLIIGEITCRKMIVVLNKIDLLPVENRDSLVEKMTNKLKKTLSTTVYADVDVPIVSVSAHPENKIGIEEMVECMSKFSFLPKRCSDGPFLFAVDHCFGIKGHGTIMTGTILQGSIEVDDIIDIPQIGATKKIKSMQMFKKPIERAMQGDRLGICVTQVEAKNFERGIACTPGYGTFISFAVIRVNAIKYFKYPIKSKSKFHITMGHETSLAKITVFHSDTTSKFNFNAEYRYCAELDTEDASGTYFLLLEFEKPVFALHNSTLIGSKLDIDINKNMCRLAFWGNILESSKEKNNNFLEKLKIFKLKSKTGIVERIVNDNTVIVKNMFNKNADLQKFLNFAVTLSSGEVGKIESTFGQSGKIKVFISDCIQANSVIYDTKIVVTLQFKKYVFDVGKKIYQ